MKTRTNFRAATKWLAAVLLLVAAPVSVAGQASLGRERDTLTAEIKGWELERISNLSDDVSREPQEQYDITGTWTYTVEGFGPSTYSFESLGGGRYKFQQAGYGGATGIAVVTGRRIRIDWTCCGESWAGHLIFDLDETGTVGTGTSVVTKGARPGTFKARISRTGTARKKPSEGAAREKALADEPADVEVLEVVGEVELSPGGDDSNAHPLEAGDGIDEADRIFTSMDSYAILRFRRDGHIVKVGPVTDLKVGAFRDQGTLVQARILLRGGEVSAQVNKQTERPSDFAVKTPSNSGVRGHHASDPEGNLEVRALPTADSASHFTVKYDKQTDITTVTVSEGTVRVTPYNRTKTFLLAANQRASVARGSKVSPITRVSSHEARISPSPPTGGGTAPGTGSRINSNISGRWSGSWTNSLGEKGQTTVNINEGSGGTITGDEDGWVIENGRRSGNVLTWEYRNRNDGCRDYVVRWEIAADGRTANGTYDVTDRCGGQTYSGKYLNYANSRAAQTGVR